MWGLWLMKWIASALQAWRNCIYLHFSQCKVISPTQLFTPQYPLPKFRAQCSSLKLCKILHQWDDMKRRRMKYLCLTDRGKASCQRLRGSQIWKRNYYTHLTSKVDPLRLFLSIEFPSMDGLDTRDLLTLALLAKRTAGLRDGKCIEVLAISEIPVYVDCLWK